MRHILAESLILCYFAVLRLCVHHIVHVGSDPFPKSSSHSLNARDGSQQAGQAIDALPPLGFHLGLCQPPFVMEPDSSLTLSISNCGHGFLYATLVHAGTSHNSGSRAPFHLFPCTLGIPCPLGLHPFFRPSPSPSRFAFWV
eukprot:GGOE01013274.1.p2 GENE.GGOE01013274.1~~GGOE01013274.1.p2  ORF type:complete len:142 (-),score=2.13 GGOE01013274.1:322-747(-)